MLSFVVGGTIFSTLFDRETAILTPINDEGIVKTDSVTKVAINPDGTMEFRSGVLRIIAWNNCTIGRPAIIQTKAVQHQYTTGKIIPSRYLESLLSGLNRRVIKSSDNPIAKPKKGLNKPGIFPQIVVGAVSKP